MNHNILAVIIGVVLATPAAAEFSCAPQESPQHFAVDDDPFFSTALGLWQAAIAHRPTEGGQKNCKDVSVPGYEGFPTKRCPYSDADAGDPSRPLHAEVVLLNPSAVQLSRWTVHACRINGASDLAMNSCLKQTKACIMGNNGAQFPVVGSVVESICNSGGPIPCEQVPPSRHDRTPRNTFFRDGVNVYYKTITKWSEQQLSADVYNILFDTARSDKDILSWRSNARIAGAQRTDWKAWRKHVGKPFRPDGLPPAGFNLDDAGWGLVTRDVHKRACASDDNEMIDAVVYNRRWARGVPPRSIGDCKIP